MQYCPHFLKWLAIAVVLSFPVLSIVIHNAGNAGLVLLILGSMIGLACRVRPAQTSFATLLKQYWPLHLAMASLVIAVGLNQLSTGFFEIRNYDRALRLAMFAPVMWVILSVPLRWLKLIQWSFVLGTVIAAIKAYELTSGGLDRPSNIGFLSTIAYSNIALLLGILAALSIGWKGRHQKVAVAVKLLAFFLGIHVTILTGTRGSWLAIPVIFIFAFWFFGDVRPRVRMLALALASLLFCGVFSYSTAARARLDQVRTDISQYQSGQNVDTSIGLRFQMWKASWLLFSQHPVFGVGREHYSNQVQALASQNKISPAAAHFAHSHNELLFNMAISGIFGLLASMAIYMAPAYYYLRDIRHADAEVRTAAAMGCVMCLCFFVYGFTDVMFFWTVLGGFYTMAAAVFLCLILRRKQALEQIS